MAFAPLHHLVEAAVELGEAAEEEEVVAAVVVEEEEAAAVAEEEEVEVVDKEVMATTSPKAP